MYTYEDGIGVMSDVVDIRAKDTKDAERIFYKLNTPLYKGKEKQARGYICDAVILKKDWERELRNNN